MKKISILLSLLLTAVEVQAQPTPKDMQRAAQLVEEAQTHYNLLEFQSALAKYQEAYTLSRDPELLFYIGQCYEQLGDIKRADISYATYLEISADGPLRFAVSSLLEQHKAQTPSPTFTLLQDAPVMQPNQKGHGGALYLGASAGLSLSVFSGSIAISSRLKAARIAIDGTSPDEFSSLSLRAKRASLVADLFLVGGITSGVVAHITSPAPLTNKLLLGVSGAALVTGSVAGLIALSSERAAETASDPAEARFQDTRATIFSRTADLSFVSAALLGGAGVWLSLKREAHATISPTPGGVTLLLGF